MISLNKLPKNWVLSNLGTVLLSVKGKRPKNLGAKNKERIIPYIDIAAFEKNVFLKYTDGVNCQFCELEDVLIVWDGARCGLVGMNVRGALGSTLSKLVCPSLNSKYLFCFLKTKYGYINKSPKGVGIPHVNPNRLFNLSFPIAPLPEQERIVAKIEELFSRLDAGVESLEKAKRSLKLYRQSVLKAAFKGKLTEKFRKTNSSSLTKLVNSKRKDLEEFPDSWDIVPLEHCVNVLDYKRRPINSSERKKRIKDKPKSELYPYYGATGKVGLIDNYLFDEELVLLGEDGAPFLQPFAEKAYLVSGKFWVNNHAHVLKAIDRVMLNKFLCFQLNLVNYQKYVTGTTRFKLNQGRMKNIPLILPSIPEQTEIVDEIERRFSIADALEKSIDENLERAEQLRASILKTAFEGNLVPQDPNDEPASVLLERIKAEKARIESENKKKKKTRKRK